MDKIHTVLCRRLRSSNRFMLLLVLLGFFWILYVIKVQLDFHRQQLDKDELRERIIQLSKEYVSAVAKERKEQLLSIDGQTNTIELKDLRQTTAILLQNMLDRLQVLEKQVEVVVTQSAQEMSQLSQQLKSLNDSIRKFNFSREPNVHKCQTPNDASFPDCAAKVQWLREHWKSNQKFSRNGVNGSLCSFLHYLSEVETWCPILPGRQKISKDDCKVPQVAAFPNCGAKVEWMKSSWKKEPCYAKEYGVNDTICSFLTYLSEVEQWCPKSSGSTQTIQKVRAERGKVNVKHINADKLLDILTHVVAQDRLAWIRSRAARMWSYWTDAFKELQSRVNATDRPMKKVLIHIGVLAEEKRLHFAATAGKGGPLGELVQWCDLITSFYILGHEIRVTVDNQELISVLDINTKQSCPPKQDPKFDLIFTDYSGLSLFKKKASGLFGYYGCRLRILDSFGTEAQFNYIGPQARFSPSLTGGGPLNAVGKYNLNLKQYMIMFPHSPDNTFLGFVVDSKKNVPKTLHKKPQALAYGKHYYMWKDLKNRGFLDAIHEHYEIHATTGGLPLAQVKAYLPRYVINHGVVSPSQLQQLLRDSKLFIGLGSPYEGPAPLEAISQGCFFINPKFNPPRNRMNTKFFHGKPTFRSLTSQHPYAEEFIGEPRVLTVDINDVEAVKNALKKISNNNQSSPYLPFEYTHEGMLERVNALIHNQDLCASLPTWPPLTSRHVLVGEAGQSCKDVCIAKDFVCEPAFFNSINNVQFLKQASFPCNINKPVMRPSLVAPAYVSGENICVLQQTPLLYSCTSSHITVQRTCPCRDYRKGQVALCKTCY